MKMRNIINLIENTQTDQEIHDWCDTMGVNSQPYRLENGQVTVDGDVKVHLPYYTAGDNKLPVTFSHAKGDFDVSNNELLGLYGSPRQVDGSFICKHNELVNLNGAPDHVEKNFDCSWNQIRSFVGLPAYIGGVLNCENNGQVPYAAYAEIASMDYLTEVVTGAVIGQLINEFLFDVEGDLSKPSNKVHFRLMILKFAKSRGR